MFIWLILVLVVSLIVPFFWLRETKASHRQRWTRMSSELEFILISGIWIKKIKSKIKEARHHLETQLKLNNKYLELHEPTIVFDIDGTSLMTFIKVSERFLRNLKPLEEKKEAPDSHEHFRPPILPVLRFYQWALKKKFKIFFVSNRTEDTLDHTIKNLKIAGYTEWTGIFLRHCSHNLRFKDFIRQRIVKEGCEIWLSLGDNDSDFDGQETGKIIRLPRYDEF